MSPGAHVCTSGGQAQSLTSLDTNVESADMLTANFTSGRGVAAILYETAHCMCAVAWADAVPKSDAIAVQINRINMEAPIQAEAMYTWDGRLCLRSCRLREDTGVDAEVVSSAAPVLYGCADAAEVRAHLDAQPLTGAKDRFNVRGVLQGRKWSDRWWV